MLLNPFAYFRLARAVLQVFSGGIVARVKYMSCTGTKSSIPTNFNPTIDANIATKRAVKAYPRNKQERMTLEFAYLSIINSALSPVGLK